MKRFVILAVVLAFATPAFALSPVRLSEVFANNLAVPNGDNTITDWVELYNPGPGVADISNTSLSDSALLPRRFVFPAGTPTIPAGGFLVIKLDSLTAPSPSNAGFGLKASGDTIFFYDTDSALIDAVSFGIQAANFTIARVPANGGAWVLGTPTRGAENTAAPLGDNRALKVNEWFATGSGGTPDYFELYNPGALPVDLSGLFVSDNSPDQNTHRIADLTFIGIGPTGAYAKFVADNQPEAGPDHVRFALGASGDDVRIFTADLLETIDAVSFGPQAAGGSEGRLPDGSATILRFPNTPTPGEPNVLLTTLTNIAVNELLAHTDPPVEDAIEFINLTDAPLDISGWYLSDSKDDLTRYRITNGTVIAAHGLKVFYEFQFNAANVANPTHPFNFNSALGGVVYLTQADANSNLIGFVERFFDASQNGVSFGRHVKSDGVDFVPMSARSFGQDAAKNLATFRKGTGLPNPAPKSDPVVINEIMFQPPPDDTNDNTLDEFIELKNTTAKAVPLRDVQYPTNHWQLRNAVDYDFPTNAVIPASGTLLVVNFDPVTNATQLAAFRIKYNVPASVPIFGPYGGKLDNNGETIELFKPDPVQLPPHPDAGFVPYIRVDKVKYNDEAPWPTNANGTGLSIQRKSQNLYGDDPVNWVADVPTAGLRNEKPPVITAPPQDLTVNVTNTAAFTVAFTGAEPLRIQWQYKGKAIKNATNATFNIAKTAVKSAGPYRVVVTNIAGAATSSVANLTVLVPVTISTKPKIVKVAVGKKATFKVSAKGTLPLTYQWKFNGEPIVDATNKTFIVLAVQGTNAGNYSVDVTNPAGTRNGAVATLTVTGLPAAPATPFIARTSRTAVTSDALDSVTLSMGLAPATTVRTDGIAPPRRIVISGAPGTYAIEATTDFVIWTQLGTVNNVSGQAEFSDADAGQHWQRFYRAVRQPTAKEK